jgi:hypothetical protein
MLVMLLGVWRSLASVRPIDCDMNQVPWPSSQRVQHRGYLEHAVEVVKVAEAEEVVEASAAHHRAWSRWTVG